MPPTRTSTDQHDPHRNPGGGKTTSTKGTTIMTTNRIVKTRVDGVKQAYHTGKTVQAREAVKQPAAAPLAPLAPPAKTAAPDFPVGFDAWGYNELGIHAVTGTQYSPDGWNIWGYDERGISHSGWHENGTNVHTGTRWGKDKYNVDGFRADGTHRETGTQYSLDGFDIKDRNADGKRSFEIKDEYVNSDGFDKNKVFVATGEMVNAAGFDKSRIHQTTNTGWAPDGFSMNGWSREGVHRETGTMWNPGGFSQLGIHEETGTRYNKAGLSVIGFGRAQSPTKCRGSFSKEQLITRRELDFPKPGDPDRKTPAEVWTSLTDRRAAAHSARGAAAPTPRPRTSSAPLPPERKKDVSSVFGDRVQLYMPGASDETRDNLAEAIRRAYLKR